MKTLLQVLRLKVATEMFPLQPTRLMKSQITLKTWRQPSGKHRRYTLTVESIHTLVTNGSFFHSKLMALDVDNSGVTF